MDGCFLVYDVSNLQSFHNLSNWLNQLPKHSNYVVVVVGNKIDLERKVETAEGRNFAIRNGFPFFGS